jgi:hypothetical protein
MLSCWKLSNDQLYTLPEAKRNRMLVALNATGRTIASAQWVIACACSLVPSVGTMGLGACVLHSVQPQEQGVSRVCIDCCSLAEGCAGVLLLGMATHASIGAGDEERTA